MTRQITKTLVLSLLGGLAVVLFLALAYPIAWPLTIDIGTRDARFVSGFHEPEQFGDTLFRWTTERSELALPRAPAGQATIMLRLLNGYPDGQPDPRLTVSVDSRNLGSFDITRRPSGVRRYTILVPITERADWATHLLIESTTYSPLGDPRPLGAVLDRVSIAPTLRSANIPPLWLIASAFVLGALTTLAVGLAGVGRIAMIAVPLLVALLVAIGVVLRPLEILPFIQRLAAIPAIACLGLGLVRLLVPIISARSNSVRERIAVRGIDLPILLAVTWWMLPVFQWAQIRDGASIGVGDETFWLAGIAALAVVVAVAIALAQSRDLAGSERAALIARYALMALALGAAIHLSYALWYAFTRSGKDFWILFKGARDWARGGSLYDLDAVMTNHVGAVFKVPPFYGMLFTPFVFQDGLQILFFHRMINLGLMIATALVWLRMFRPLPRWWGVATLLILLNSRPLADTIAYGQIDLLLLFLLTCALWAMRSERNDLAGILVALGTLFKVYPLILLAFFVLKGRWRAVGGFLIGMLVFNGIAIAVMGWEMHRIYLFEVIPRIGGTTSWVENQTISGFLARITDVPFDAHIFENRALSLLGTALSGLLSLAACWLTLRPADGRSTAFALQYAQFLLLMVLAVPAAWMHYETLLVLPFGLLLLHLREQVVSLPRAVVIALAFALVSYGNQWSFNGTTVMGFLTIAGISYKFYGMLLFSGLLTACLLEQRMPLFAPRAKVAPLLTKAG